MEIDYQRWFEDRIALYLDAHPFDFVIGSVHHIDRVMLMTPEYNQSRTAQTAYQDYFHAVADSVQCGLFDILGHLEYANRRGLAAWGPYRTEDYREELTALMDLVIAKGLTFEINTAGLHRISASPIRSRTRLRSTPNAEANSSRSAPTLITLTNSRTPIPKPPALLSPTA